MDPFIGEIRAFAFDYAPEGWLQCQGQILPIAQYQALFALLGNRYGGNGTTQFALPDLRGRTIIGVKPPQQGQTPYPIAFAAGVETVPMNVDQIPPHSHTVTLSGLTATLKGNSGGADSPEPGGHALAAPEQPIYNSGTPDTAMAAGSVAVSGTGTCAVTGSGAAHPNMQPYLTLNYCIAINGIFPPRP